MIATVSLLRCDHHKLESCTAIASSASGQYVYARCLCGQRRVIPEALWAQERLRRESEGRLMSVEPRRFADTPIRLTGPEIACCGQWWPLTSVPWLCPNCGHRQLWAREAS